MKERWKENANHQRQFIVTNISKSKLMREYINPGKD